MGYVTTEEVYAVEPPELVDLILRIRESVLIHRTESTNEIVNLCDLQLIDILEKIE